MSPRGRINQQVTDWRTQPVPHHPPHSSQVESVLQHAIDRNRPAADAPDTRDGINLLVIILFVWFVCLIAGYAIGRN